MLSEVWGIDCDGYVGEAVAFAVDQSRHFWPATIYVYATSGACAIATFIYLNWMVCLKSLFILYININFIYFNIYKRKITDSNLMTSN